MKHFQTTVQCNNYVLGTMHTYNDILPGDLHAVLAQVLVFAAFGVTSQFGMWYATVTNNSYSISTRLNGRDMLEAPCSAKIFPSAHFTQLHKSSCTIIIDIY